MREAIDQDGESGCAEGSAGSDDESVIEMPRMTHSFSAPGPLASTPPNTITSHWKS
jgi:hypothetical protein